MREEKQLKPSPKKSWQKQPWFWPVIYGGIAVVLIGLIVTYSVVINDEEQQEVVNETSTSKEDDVVVETNTRVETMKYPFNEEHLEQVQVLQDFYDMNADAETRENALLVFNQTFSTSSGVSLSMNGEPFEVLAAMSGEVKEVKLDDFTGNEIVITHTNGMETRYSSVTDILVKEGDSVVQGQPIATTTENEWNPTAGIHLHFEVLEDGEHVNPRSFLAF